MKFKKAMIIALLMLGSILLVGAAKTNDITEEIIPSGTVIEENHFFTGDKFENNGTIDGSLFVIAQDVLINGDINGNIFILSQNETIINGEVKGDIYIAATSKISITGRVDGSIFVVSNVVSIESRANINRSLYAVGQEINVYGIIDRNANLYASNNLLVKGVILGDLKYNSQTTNIVEGSVKGQTTVNKVAENDANKLFETTQSRLFSTISFIFTNLIIWFLLAFVFKDTRKKTSSLLQANKNKLFFLYGLVGLLATVGIGIVFLISYIGIPFGLFVLLLMFGLLYVATGIFIVTLSDIIGSKYPKFAGGNNIIYVIGFSVIYSLIKLVPFISPMISMLVVIFGYGLIIGSFYHKPEEEEEHNLIL
ncbi:MAG: polymer-forming cytoskeletal protein [Firmicutes bacterium]|nr:polymer-forming cytoskeletal protein [Bacillota bacterium]